MVVVVLSWAHLAAVSRGCNIAGVTDVLGTVNLKVSHFLTGSAGGSKSYLWKKVLVPLLTVSCPVRNVIIGFQVMEASMAEVFDAKRLLLNCTGESGGHLTKVMVSCLDVLETKEHVDEVAIFRTRGEEMEDGGAQFS